MILSQSLSILKKKSVQIIRRIQIIGFTCFPNSSCVHITQATRDLLQGDYDIRDGDGVLGVQFGANLKTYFVHPPPYEPVEVRKFPGTCHRKSSSEVTIANGVRVYFFVLRHLRVNSKSSRTFSTLTSVKKLLVGDMFRARTEPSMSWSNRGRADRCLGLGIVEYFRPFECIL